MLADIDEGRVDNAIEGRAHLAILQVHSLLVTSRIERRPLRVEDGNLAVAHVGFGVVWLFSRRGEPLFRIDSCEGAHTSNVAYGGPDRRSLFITESDSATILRAELPIAGLRSFSGV